MIKYHPKDELLAVFARGELPASLSCAISIHADMCPKCKNKITQMTDDLANKSFDQHEFDNDTAQNNELDMFNIDQMVDAIVANDTLAKPTVFIEKQVNIADKTFTLPQAIQNIELGKFTQLGKLSRARFQLDEGEIHSSLLHIKPGGGVPEHTHKGYELTLLLEGSFSDELGDYVPGDFIMLDSSVTHQPYSEQGCLCFTVVNDALHFTQGINRLLNPIGAFIY